MTSMLVLKLEKVPDDHRVDINAISEQLGAPAARRRDRIDLLDEPYCRSKTSWKVAVFSNAVLFRFVALAEGVALSWNHSHYLSAVLNERAMVETAAFYWHFVRDFERSAKFNDICGVDDAVNYALFATRDEELLRDRPELKSQILNSIDVAEKEIPGFRRHYEGLSEFCHPNSFGHHGLFSLIDKSTGITTFQSRGGEAFIHAIKCALGTSPLIEVGLNRTDRLIPILPPRITPLIRRVTGIKIDRYGGIECQRSRWACCVRGRPEARGPIR